MSEREAGTEAAQICGEIGEMVVRDASCHHPVTDCHGLGNSAAMRKALESVRNWCLNRLFNSSHQVTVEGLLSVVNAALSQTTVQLRMAVCVLHDDSPQWLPHGQPSVGHSLVGHDHTLWRTGKAPRMGRANRQRSAFRHHVRQDNFAWNLRRNQGDFKAYEEGKGLARKRWR